MLHCGIASATINDVAHVARWRSLLADRDAHMSLFWIDRGGHAQALERPEDVRRHLSDPKKQWRDGFSAAELAKSWIGSNGIPDPVASVLRAVPDLSRARLEAGYFEHRTRLRSRGTASQTDLLAVVQGTQRWTVAVEGKRDEPFGPLVRDWACGAGKAVRLRDLCEMLDLEADSVGDLRYQLFHRAAAGLLEARRRGTPSALLLVHSFSPHATSFDAFQAFAARLGAPVHAPGGISTPVTRFQVLLRLAWVHDPKPIG